MPKLESRPLAWFKVEEQTRKHFDEAELRLLGESLRKKQLQPVLARPDGTIIVGERRYRAALLAGLATLLVIIVEGDPGKDEIRFNQLTENLLRADLTHAEKAQAFEEELAAHPDWQAKDLAEHLHLDPSTVTRYLSPSKCIPEVREALVAGKLGISDTYAISKADPADQPALLALRLSGVSRDELEKAGRKRRADAKPVVRTSKLRCPLVSGPVVTVSGEGVSLDEAIDALKEATKAMTKARDTGLDAKTAQAVWRDLAAKG